MLKGFEITNSEIDNIGDMWRFDMFDLKVLIGRDLEYIKSILHHSWSNHFQGGFVLTMTTIRIKKITQDKLSINFVTERRLKVKLGLYKTLSKTWSWLIKKTSRIICKDFISIWLFGRDKINLMIWSEMTQGWTNMINLLPVCVVVLEGILEIWLETLSLDLDCCRRVKYCSGVKSICWECTSDLEPS